MTPGDNGASTPEDDDPFGYLYADGQARGAQPPSGGYGYPNSVSRVRTVGERSYGQPPQATYGQGVPQQGVAHGQGVPQQGAYGQPNAHYQAPETLPGGAQAGHRSAPPAGDTGRRGPNTKGLLIGAIAVVAAVVIGIGIAMINGNTDDDKPGNQADAGATQSQSHSQAPSPSGSGSAAPGELPKVDGGDAGLQLAGGAAGASDVTGARSADGKYVGGLNQAGASVTWTVKDIPEDGPYTLFVNYSATGEDQSMSVIVNGKEFGSKVGFKNWRHAADGDFAQGWTKSYVWPDLKKGPNTIAVSCQPGDKCNVLIDQMWIKKGHVTS
ncbi:carbohydrate-binding protein [Streptomyces sp. 5-8]|uniref:Carbohydrate-binding protein n=1 Tax=Streptomyces musisoli TaxID=2802280 RepID=A0ABS1PDU6_9ACTN|nr:MULTISPECIES: carbohydrate-binding protein [Streptomyces]MBL1110227.1 carbohydrate-binding protein [Streptomyces musisoli]MBY8843336.1 carbohydrate-binding protein [Streptomyces sp. SP2-10]